MYPFREKCFALNGAWYVLGFSRDIGTELVSRWLLNEPVVMFRKQDGEVVVLSGVCPHRFFPLGKSRLLNDSIVCGYHGMTFDSTGACIRVPGQDHIPETCRLRKYPVVEHGMWVWVWTGDPERPDRSLLPGLREIGYEGPGFHAEPFYFHEVSARYQLLNDNILDLSHIAFLHADSADTVENTAELEETTIVEERVVKSRRYVRNDPIPPMFKHFGKYGETWDKVIGADFHPPGLHVGVGDFCYPEDAGDRAGMPIQQTRFYHVITPATTDTCYYFFGMSADAEWALEAMRPYMIRLIEEDIFASEAIEDMLRVGRVPPREVMKRSDKTGMAGRRMLEEMILAEQTEESVG